MTNINHNEAQEEIPIRTWDDGKQLTIIVSRDCLSDDALERLEQIIDNKRALFRRALQKDFLPFVTSSHIFTFPWFTLTGVDGEIHAYKQFVTALCKMAKEEKIIRNKPYEGGNDRSAMRMLMVRMGMTGTEFALARKLMMKNLTDNNVWRNGAQPKMNEA